MVFQIFRFRRPFDFRIEEYYLEGNGVGADQSLKVSDFQMRCGKLSSLLKFFQKHDTSIAVLFWKPHMYDKKDPEP